MCTVVRVETRGIRTSRGTPSGSSRTRSNSGCGTIPAARMSAPSRPRRTALDRRKVGSPGPRLPSPGSRPATQAPPPRPPAASTSPRRPAGSSRARSSSRRRSRRQPGVVAVDRGVDQVELADEAARSPGSRPARASRWSAATPATAATRRARDRGDVVAERGLALAGDDHREGREVHDQVDGEVEDRRLHAELRRRRRRRRACSRPARRSSRRAGASASDWPSAPTLPTMIVTRPGPPAPGPSRRWASIERDVDQPQRRRRTPRPSSRRP